MGSGKIFNFHETDDTRAASRDALFEEILKRIQASGKITSDEKIPMYDEIGTEEAEIGHERVIYFTLNNLDFELVRKVQTNRITGAGRHKSLEPLNPPKTAISLKKKDLYKDEWTTVDLDAFSGL